MTLFDKIMYIYPSLTAIDFEQYITLVNDGQHEYIAVWRHPSLAEPTAAQLAAVPDVPYVPIPQQVPMWAVRTVLQNDGLFDQAQALINETSDNALKNVWEYGNFADRNSRAINVLAIELSLTEAQVDQMFIDANNLSV
jgi:hypothetical protein